MARKSRKNLDVLVEQTVFESPVYNTALYIRLSVEDNKKRGNSIDSQKAILENYVSLNPELKIYDIYIDNGSTGTNFERDGFKRMMDDAEAGKVSCIIVKDLSRLGRNAIDTGYYIEKYFPIKHIRFISVNDRFDSLNNDNVHGGIILPLKNIINEAYSFDIGRKIKAQAHQSMKSGEYIGARPPHGYLKAPDNCHQLVIDEETAPVVRQIFEWAFEGKGLNTIVKLLNEAGITSPSHYKREKGLITHDNLVGSGKWQTFTVNKILSDEVYVGDMVQGKSKSIDHKQVPVSKEHWITVRNTHEPIVSRAIFDAVQKQREQVADKSIKRAKNAYSDNIFKGIIFCSCCGKNLHRQRNTRKKGPDVYLFHCIANSRLGKGACPVDSFSINENDLKKKVVEYLRSQSTTNSSESLLVQESDLLLRNRQNEVQAKVSRLKQDIGKKQQFMQSLYENLVKGVIAKNEYIAMKSSYESQITAMMDNIFELETGIKEFETQTQITIEQAKSMSRVSADGKLTAELVSKLIERIDVFPSKEIKVTLYSDNQHSAEVRNHG